jgi:BirA family biotin operon repressor/biotin-[acetyl-CoA-carboxylase] ligase
MIIGSKLYRTKTCANSLSWAREHLDTAPDGSVFIADTLTKAYGRQGRTWQVYPGQLLITLLLKPPLLHECSLDDIPVRLNQLNMALSVGIAKALESYGVHIKWPNDFVVQDKKAGGLLAHVVWQNNWPAGVIFGFGINVNTHFDKDDALYTTATSLAMATGHDLDMRALYRNLLNNLDTLYALWKDKKFDDIYRQWKARQAYLGKRLTIHQKNGCLVSGLMSQVMPNGDMMLLVEDKVTQIIPFCVVSDVKLEDNLSG